MFDDIHVTLRSDLTSPFGSPCSITTCVQLPLAFAALFQKSLNSNMMHGVNGYARALSLVSAGYFVTDIAIVATNFKEHGPEPFLHALICVTFFVYSSVKRRMQFFVPRVLMYELSTPFVHARWLLKVLGLSRTRLYRRNGLAMIASFFGCRIVWGTCALPSLPRGASSPSLQQH